jgi:serine-type D-Ala-D-Ala endopeptidase (penicillin-binding protein 7)
MGRRCRRAAISRAEGELHLKRLLVVALVFAVAATGAFAQESASRPTRDAALAAKAGMLSLKSSSALVIDQNGSHVLYAKNVDTVSPVASITKLMTAMVSIDGGGPLAEPVTISDADVDDLKHTRSRLKVGTTLSREALLKLALIASENRAAAALARAHPGGVRAFVAAMNQKAMELEMWHTRFVDGTGLSSENVSTAQDLARLVLAAYRYPLIREFTTTPSYAVELPSGRLLHYNNSNGLVKNAGWSIGLSNTGYISEAGRCLVMQSRIASMSVVIVLLDSWGKNTRLGDANRIKKWMESVSSRQPAG